MAETQHIEVLSKLPFLGELSEDAIQSVCALFGDVSEAGDVAEGNQLFQEGYLGFATGYILLDGKVRIEREGKDSVELEGPQLLGEMSQFVEDDARTATALALSDVKILKFSWDDLYEKAKEQLSEEENKSFLQAIEQVVWERYELGEIMNVAMLNDVEDNLKVRVCLPFPWISKPIKLANNESLFEAGTKCKSQGFLLTQGSISIIFPSGEQIDISAPNILGIMPNHKPDRLWSASARASGDAEVLTFNWQEFDKKLRDRLSNDELKQFFESLKINAKRHFWH